jgi:outer membrane beta-barrel protein
VPAPRHRWLVAALLLAAAPARADDAPATPTTATTDQPCEEDEAHRKGVQKREFQKKLRVELSAWGGLFAADLVSTSYAWGGAIAFYPTEDFGIEASLVVTRFTLSVEQPLTQLFGGQTFPAGLAWAVVGNALWSPVHFKLRATDRAIVHGDFFIALGAGDTLHDSVQGVTFDGGIGLKLYPTRWLAVRFDLRDYVMLQEALGVQRTANNVVGVAGLSVFLPP